MVGKLVYWNVSIRKELIQVNTDYWIRWIKAASVRAVKTMAQTAVALLPAAAMITDVNWQVVAGTAALAGIASLLTSLAGIPEVEVDEDR